MKIERRSYLIFLSVHFFAILIPISSFLQICTLFAQNEKCKSTRSLPSRIVTNTIAFNTPTSIDFQETLENNSVINSKSGEFRAIYDEIKISTGKGISLHDLSMNIRQLIEKSGVKCGQVNVLTRHTTTAIIINEMEGRLVDDTRQFLLALAPPSFPYLHNDIHLRSGPAGWPGGDEAWRAQEPQNCHSHLLSMLLGTDATIPINNGQLMIGTWQSVILVELDGSRNRSVSIQVQGTT